MNKLSINIPFFPGFYGGALDSIIDNDMESEAENWREKEKENETPKHLYISSREYADMLFDCATYGDAQRQIAKDWLEILNNKIKDELSMTLKLEFEEMTSPKYYNFETDKVFAFIPEIKVKAMRGLCKMRDNDATLKEVIRERHTSYDGFHSFYDNQLGEWPDDVTQWDYHQLGTLLVACIRLQIKHHGADFDDIMRDVEYSLHEHSYEYFDKAINWTKLDGKIEERRKELQQEYNDENGIEEIIIPYRCTETPDLFANI